MAKAELSLLSLNFEVLDIKLPDNPNCISFDSQNNWIALGLRSKIIVSSIDNGEVIATFEIPDSQITSIDWLTSGKHLLAASTDRNVYLLSICENDVLATYEHGDPVDVVMKTKFDSIFITQDGSSLNLWHVKDGHIDQISFHGAPNSTAISQDRVRVAVVTDKGEICILNLTPEGFEKWKTKIYNSKFTSVAWIDEQQNDLAVLSSENEILVISLGTLPDVTDIVQSRFASRTLEVSYLRNLDLISAITSTGKVEFYKTDGEYVGGFDAREVLDFKRFRLAHTKKLPVVIGNKTRKSPKKGQTENVLTLVPLVGKPKMIIPTKGSLKFKIEIPTSIKCMEPGKIKIKTEYDGLEHVRMKVLFQNMGQIEDLDVLVRSGKQVHPIIEFTTDTLQELIPEVEVQFYSDPHTISRTLFPDGITIQVNWSKNLKVAVLDELLANPDGSDEIAVKYAISQQDSQFLSLKKKIPPKPVEEKPSDQIEEQTQEDPPDEPTTILFDEEQPSGSTIIMEKPETQPEVEIEETIEPDDDDDMDEITDMLADD